MVFGGSLEGGSYREKEESGTQVWRVRADVGGIALRAGGTED